MRTRRQLLTSLLLVMALTGTAIISPALAAEFPYQAVTSGEGTPLRCGPGQQHYATRTLPAGTQLEVYQQDPNGWCAIRPLAECFSLIPSQQTRLADGASLAEVTTDKAVSWIGTALDENQQLLWQVQLEQGEAVEIIGIVRRESLTGEGKDLWYKIRPPAGEFRYVHVDDLTRSPSRSVASEMQFVPIADAQVKVATHEQEETVEQNATEAADVPQSQWRVQRNPRARTETEETSRAIAIVEPPVASPRATPAARPSRKELAGDPDTILNEFDVKLSLMAAQPVSSWDFSEFEQKLARLDQMDTTTRHRTRMVRFRKRLQNFVDHQAKQATLATPAAETTPTTPIEAASDTEQEQPIGAGLAATPDSAAAAPAELDTPQEKIPAEYDGMGYLMPVISREQQAPPFALLDKTGKVLGFVSPVPGLNLRRYVKQEVGVIGQRGYLPKYQATHLTAQRIIVLDRHR